LASGGIKEVTVERSVALKVEYAKRQHYVNIEGVEEWRVGGCG